MSVTPPAASIRRRLRVDRRQIAYLKFVLESCEGLALMRTLDPRAGTVELLIGPGCQPEVERLLEELGTELFMEPIDVPEP